MVKQIASDAIKQAKNLAHEIGAEIVRTPGEIGKEAARSIGLSRGEVKEIYAPSDAGGVSQSDAAVSTDQKLAQARAKMRSFAQRRGQEWQGVEVQAQQKEQQRVGQIVESQLGHSQDNQGVIGKESQEQKEKKSGILGELSNIFRGKRSRKMGAAGLGAAKKQASGEFGKNKD